MTIDPRRHYLQRNLSRFATNARAAAAGRFWWSVSPEECDAVLDVLAQLERIHQMHEPVLRGIEGAANSVGWMECPQCRRKAPCDTRVVLDGEPQ